MFMVLADPGEQRKRLSTCYAEGTKAVWAP